MEKLKCVKHQWKKLKEPSIILIDTLERKSAKYYMSECTICGKREEIMDKRTQAKVSPKYQLKANQRYLIGNKGNFSQYLVPEDSIFIIKEPVKKES